MSMVNYYELNQSPWMEKIKYSFEKKNLSDILNFLIFLSHGHTHTRTHRQSQLKMFLHTCKYTVARFSISTRFPMFYFLKMISDHTWLFMFFSTSFCSNFHVINRSLCVFCKIRKNRIFFSQFFFLLSLELDLYSRC